MLYIVRVFKIFFNYAIVFLFFNYFGVFIFLFIDFNLFIIIGNYILVKVIIKLVVRILIMYYCLKVRLSFFVRMFCIIKVIFIKIVIFKLRILIRLLRCLSCRFRGVFIFVIFRIYLVVLLIFVLLLIVIILMILCLLFIIVFCKIWFGG